MSITEIIKTKEKTTNRVFLKEKEIPTKIDVAIVFGNKNEYKERIDKLLEFYDSGLVKKIVLSGGKVFLSKLPEAHLMQEYAISLGINEDDIIVESKSKTTEENILYTLKTLKDKNVYPKNILLISSDYHIKRCLQLTNKILKENKGSIKLFTASSISKETNNQNWHMTLKGITKVKKEIILLNKK